MGKSGSIGNSRLRHRMDQCFKNGRRRFEPNRKDEIRFELEPESVSGFKFMRPRPLISTPSPTTNPQALTPNPCPPVPNRDSD